MKTCRRVFWCPMFQQMLDATESVVGKSSAESWKFALRVLWESGFRIGDKMDFSWNDPRHIHPLWPTQKGQFPTEKQIARLRSRAERCPRSPIRRIETRLIKERVGRVIGLIGMEAGIIVQLEDSGVQRRKKFASAHDIRRGLAQRLINAGGSAETLKVVMRHKDFATAERHYGALRSAQSAAAEISTRLAPYTENIALVGRT